MIISPESNVALPDKLQASIDAARNNVTILEAEVNRLKGIVTAEQYTISQLTNQKAELNSQLEDIKKLKESGIKELESITNDAKELTTKLLELNNDANNIKKERVDFDKFVRSKENEISEKSTELFNKDIELNKREEFLAQGESELATKLKKVREISNII